MRRGLAWTQDALRSARKGRARKAALARELRSHTTMTLAWTARRLSLGSRGYLALLLCRAGQSPPGSLRGHSLLQLR